MRRTAASRTWSKKVEIMKSRQTTAEKPDLTTLTAAASTTSKMMYLIYLSPVKTSVLVETVDIPTLQFGTNLLWIMIIYVTQLEEVSKYNEYIIFCFRNFSDLHTVKKKLFW